MTRIGPDAARCVHEVMFALVAGSPHTAMAVELAEAIREDGGFRPANVLWRYAVGVTERTLDAGRIGERVLRGVGRGLSPAQALSALNLPERALVSDPGPLLRAGPLAALRAVEGEELVRAVLVEAALTNPHPVPGDLAVALTGLLRACIGGMSWSDALDQARAGRLHETRRALSPSRSMTLDSEGTGLAMLRCAVFFVDQSASRDAALRDCRAFAPDAHALFALTHLIAAARFADAGRGSLAPEQRAARLADFFSAPWAS